ncbi:MAG: DUF554 domain-containing protein [Carnobacterium sp.]|uniref:DUF554 domain-containing protein n=1 Tax=Carnobacterium sp. TaxID=48221 RepID=UPI0033148C9B
MILFGSIINGLAVVLGGSIGLVLKKGLSKRIGTAIMNSLALCVLYIGFSGALAGGNILITIGSMVIGVIIGEGMNLDEKVNNLGNLIETKFQTKDDTLSISKGFITASLLVCVGAMSIVGALQSGLTGNHETLLAKSLIDGIAALVLASSLGVGVLLAGGLVLIYEGSISLLASVIAPLLTESVISEMTCVGSLLIIGLALNMLKITDLKIMNYAPAAFIPIVFGLFY